MHPTRFCLIWSRVVEIKEVNSPSCEKRKKNSLFHRPILATQSCLSPPIPIQYDTDCHYTIYSDVRFAQQRLLSVKHPSTRPYHRIGSKILRVHPSTKVVVSVMCLFCVYFGCKTRLAPNGKLRVTFSISNVHFALMFTKSTWIHSILRTRRHIVPCQMIRRLLSLTRALLLCTRIPYDSTLAEPKHICTTV